MDLYKFRSVTTNNLAALANNQIWFSSLSDFNDPFEGAYILNSDLPSEIHLCVKLKSKEEVGEEAYLKMLKKMGLQEGNFTEEIFFKKMVELDFEKTISIVHNAKIASFSLFNEDRDPILENLMWSHYADGLRGYCLVFDYEELQKHICYSAEKAIRPIKVKYQDIPNTINLVDFANSNSFLNINGDNHIPKTTETIGTKSSDWQYENELRLLALESDNFHTYSPTNLTKIVIGEKMPKNQKKLIIDIAKRNNANIEICEARLKNKSYNSMFKFLMIIRCQKISARTISG